MLIKHYMYDTESTLNTKSFEEGSLYFIIDTNRIYLDPIGSNTRITIGGDPIVLSTESERENILSPIPNKIYIVLESNIQYIYSNNTWNQISNKAITDLSISDNTITYTRADKTTGSIAIQNTNAAYGLCETDSAIADKVVTLYSNENWDLKPNGIILIWFANTNTASNPTLNVNSTGEKDIYYKGVAIIDGIIRAGDIAIFIYDGIRYHLIGFDRDFNTLQDHFAAEPAILSNLQYGTELPTTNQVEGQLFFKLDDDTGILELDDTLSLSGKAADSKAVGDAIAALKEEILGGAW